ncbi:MAG: serine/threonine-protein phosphatase [Acidobacteria bacterium]|nr:serine/threonine-protein phosphatase [Acidobacteriota bacterium]
MLLRYLHTEWQPAWAMGCGLIAGVVVRRAVAPTYRSFPGFLSVPLGIAVVVVGTILATWATLMAPSYGGIFYFAARWRQALTLFTVAISAGLGAAGVIYSHARLQREVEQRERFEEDLRLARGIQESLLSHEFPSIPWVDSYAFNVPSRDIGGDYYEIFEDEESGDLGFAIGDVSGKGVPAALLMSTLQSSFLGVLSADQDLARVCARVNRFLVERTTPERYATFFVGWLTEDAYLGYVNAGHNPPYLLRDGEQHRLMGGGMPLGLFAEADYELQKLRLRSGDLLLCYTDGVTEAMNPEDEEFGEARLLEIATAYIGRPAVDVVTAVQDAVEAHTRGAPQHDDLTLLALSLR